MIDHHVEDTAAGELAPDSSAVNHFFVLSRPLK